MIKAFQLIFDSGATWEKISRAKRSLWTVFLLHLTPVVILSVAGELLGKFYLSNSHGTMVAKISQSQLIEYGVIQFLASFLVVFVGAKLVKAAAETFHARHTFTQSFTAVAYGLTPFFLARLLDAIPGMNPWVSFAVGIVLAIATLYQGIPCVLQPDPPNAFGLYLTSGIMLAMLAGLARLITLLLLQGRVNLL